MMKTLTLTAALLSSEIASAEPFHHDPGYLPRGAYTEILEMSCATTEKYVEKYGENSPSLAAPGNGFEGGLMDTPHATKILMTAHPGLSGGVTSIAARLGPIATAVGNKRAEALREYLRAADYAQALNTCVGLDSLYSAKLSFEDGSLRHMVDEMERKNLSGGNIRRKRSAIFEKALLDELIVCQDSKTGAPVSVWNLFKISDSCNRIYRALTRP